jgi:hypothetical protein
MKRYSSLLLFISTCLLGSSAFAQSNKLLIGVSVSPDMCYRTLKNTDGSSTASMIIDLRNENEQPKLGYSTGVALCYNFSNHWGIETGLQYSTKGEAFVNDNLTFGSSIPYYGFYSNPLKPAPTKVTFIYNYNYLDIPLRVIFSAGKGKVRFVASAGITTNLLLNATQTSIVKYEEADTERKTQDQPTDYKSLNVSPTLSAGIDWSLSTKFNVRVEPVFRYGLLKIVDAPITSYLWSGGLSITCYYAL